MKISKRAALVAVISFVFSLSSIMSASAASTPSLATTSTYGVLAHTFTYAHSGAVITGDLGYTTTSGTGGFPSVSGATNVTNAAYSQAGIDQGTVSAALNSQPCTVNLPSNVDLAVYNSGVYTPGIYCTPFASGASIGLSGITLNGSGTYIFRIAGSLITADHSVVTLSNGASACNTFWTTSPGAVVSILGAYSKFIGTLIEPEGLTLKDHLSWTGRALVYNGTLSIDEKDAISVPTCTPPPTTATFHVIKKVVNAYSGTAVPGDFNLHVKLSGVDVAGSPHVGVSTPGTTYTLNAGTYIISEDAVPGYTAIYGGDDCDSIGRLTLAAGDNKTCTLTNYDQGPPPAGTLHVVKQVINNDGGIETASSFTLHVKVSGSMGSSDVAGSPAAGVGTPGKLYTLAPGVYTVGENAFPGYTASFSGDCDTNGNVTVAFETSKTCTITNDDVATYIPPYIPPVVPPYTPPYTPPYVPPVEPPYTPPIVTPPSSPKTATLHVIKEVINNNGGTKKSSSFKLYVKKTGSSGSGNVAGSPAAGMVAPGKSYALKVGTYVVSENTNNSYTKKFSGDCDAKGKVTLVNGDDKTCIITNDDMAVYVPPYVPPVVPPVVTPPTTIEPPPDSIWTISPKLPNTAATASKPYALPMRIKIPSIGVNAPIQHVGIGKDGAMVPPTGPTNTAWFNLGPPPGVIGSSVIAGHFGHWLSGSGSVFDNLKKLKKGDKVLVTDDAGKTTTFIVRESKIYDPETYTPDTNIFLSHDGKAHLNLITCDGTWNTVTKSFPNRRVVFTDKEI
ncbi:MAG: ice-binding family protein [Candidatus Peregrinibacteria bacterium]|nr:ice-binding family protein [Candidatus Peregrinibacteria bacterium]